MNKRERKRKKREKLKNKKLVKQYYWVAPRNWCTGKIPKDYDYEYTFWELPPGWDRAFGKMFLEELDEEIKNHKQKDFTIEQIKEKYGTLRVYTGGTSEKAYQIISKYEALSENICYFCGRPDVHVTNDGWVLPVCEHCFYTRWSRGNKKYEETFCDEDARMADTYHVKQFSKDGNKIITYDYSETTNKIRKWWNKNHPDDKVEL